MEPASRQRHTYIVYPTRPKRLDEWLETLKLSVYYDKLVSAGFNKVYDELRCQLSCMTHEELKRAGISNPGHRKRLLIGAAHIEVNEAQSSSEAAPESLSSCSDISKDSSPSSVISYSPSGESSTGDTPAEEVPDAYARLQRCGGTKACALLVLHILDLSAALTVQRPAGQLAMLPLFLPPVYYVSLQLGNALAIRSTYAIAMIRPLVAVAVYTHRLQSTAASERNAIGLLVSFALLIYMRLGALRVMWSPPNDAKLVWHSVRRGMVVWTLAHAAGNATLYLLLNEDASQGRFMPGDLHLSSAIALMASTFASAAIATERNRRVMQTWWMVPLSQATSSDLAARHRVETEFLHPAHDFLSLDDDAEEDRGPCPVQ